MERKKLSSEQKAVNAALFYHLIQYENNSRKIVQFYKTLESRNETIL